MLKKALHICLVRGAMYKSLFPFRLSARLVFRYYARLYTAGKRGEHINDLYADSPRVARF